MSVYHFAVCSMGRRYARAGCGAGDIKMRNPPQFSKRFKAILLTVPQVFRLRKTFNRTPEFSGVRPNLWGRVTKSGYNTKAILYWNSTDRADLSAFLN